MSEHASESIGAPLPAAASVADYWNERLDPLDWKEPVARSDDGRWREAHAAFLAPDTLDAMGMLEPMAGMRLLEIGSAQGYGSVHFAARGARVVGIDLSERRCAIARRHAAAGSAGGPPGFAAARAERLPFPDGSFDLVFCRDVLMYTEPARVAGECARVLRPGGRAVFVESLEGHALLRWFRRATSPSRYCNFTRHLRWRELAAFGEPLELARIRPHYLLALLAFFGLFVLRSRGLYRLTLRALTPLDRRLLGRWPSLGRFAWRAAALYVKSSDAD